MDLVYDEGNSSFSDRKEQLVREFEERGEEWVDKGTNYGFRIREERVRIEFDIEEDYSYFKLRLNIHIIVLYGYRCIFSDIFLML